MASVSCVRHSIQPLLFWQAAEPDGPEPGPAEHPGPHGAALLLPDPPARHLHSGQAVQPCHHLRRLEHDDGHVAAQHALGFAAGSRAPRQP